MLKSLIFIAGFSNSVRTNCRIESSDRREFFFTVGREWRPAQKNFFLAGSGASRQEYSNNFYCRIGIFSRQAAYFQAGKDVNWWEKCFSFRLVKYLKYFFQFLPWQLFQNILEVGFFSMSDIFSSAQNNFLLCQSRSMVWHEK